MTAQGQSLPGRACSSYGLVRYAPKAEASPLQYALRVDGDALDVKSAQRPIERWHGAVSENLA
jgi:hypothetical protein